MGDLSPLIVTCRSSSESTSPSGRRNQYSIDQSPLHTVTFRGKTASPNSSSAWGQQSPPPAPIRLTPDPLFGVPACTRGREIGSWTPAVTPSLSVNRLALDRLLTVRADWARRKPMLLFRLSVVFLFRFDDRRFSGLLLFQEPPRITRWPSLGLLPL